MPLLQRSISMGLWSFSCEPGTIAGCDQSAEGLFQFAQNSTNGTATPLVFSATYSYSDVCADHDRTLGLINSVNAYWPRAGEGTRRELLSAACGYEIIVQQVSQMDLEPSNLSHF
jgi:hypothetical protein